MNSESFAEYLAQPAKLYQLPYQEIKNLVAEYPYAGNLRLLMFIKSKIEQDPSLEAHLHQLAAHTFDRDHLFDLNHQQLKEMLDLATGHEERLELQDLSTLSEKEFLMVDLDSEEEQPLAELAVPSSAVPSAGFENDIIEEKEELEIAISDDSSLEFISESDEVELEPEVLVKEIPASPSPLLTEGVKFKLSSELLDTIAAFPLLYIDGQPQDKETFPSWKLYQAANEELQLGSLLKKAKDFNPPSTKQVAAKSVQQKPNVATETLAKLLEKQGSYDKAIKMYEQLCLLYPDKSRYFAATIEKLKKNI